MRALRFGRDETAGSPRAIGIEFESEQSREKKEFTLGVSYRCVHDPYMDVLATIDFFLIIISFFFQSVKNNKICSA